MKVIVNGQEREVGVTNLRELVEELGFDVNRYVVVVNNEIIPKSRVAEITLKENDDIEILTIMGGG
ncbi:MAG: sulfur carrier protein ThiS [Brevinematia bacterium]